MIKVMNDVKLKIINSNFEISLLTQWQDRILTFINLCKYTLDCVTQFRQTF